MSFNSGTKVAALEYAKEKHSKSSSMHFLANCCTQSPFLDARELLAESHLAKDGVAPPSVFPVANLCLPRCLHESGLNLDPNWTRDDGNRDV